MFYRVDYRVALVVAGALATVMLARRAARVDPQRLVRGYLVVTAIAGAVPVALYVARFVAGDHPVPARLPASLGDLGILLEHAGFAVGHATHAPSRSPRIDPLSSGSSG